MALKPGRLIVSDEIGFFMTDVAERGGIALFSTVGSGEALDQGAALVGYPISSLNATAAGLLLNDVVSIDLTRQHLNQYKDEVQIGSKVQLMTRGWVTTNLVSGTITAGGTAYAGPYGYITATNVGSASPTVGKFLSKADEDGYARVSINL